MGHCPPEWDFQPALDDGFSLFDFLSCDVGNLPDLDAPIFYPPIQTPPSETRETNNSPPARTPTNKGDGGIFSASDTTFIGEAHSHATDRTDVPSQILDLDASEPLIDEVSEQKRARLIMLGLERLKKSHQITLLDLRQDLHDLVALRGPHGLSVKPKWEPKMPNQTDDIDTILLKQGTNKLLLEILTGELEEHRLHNMAEQPPTAQEIICKIHQTELLIAQDDFQIFLFNRKQADSLGNVSTQVGDQGKSVRLVNGVASEEPLPTSAGVPIVQFSPHKTSSVVLRPRSGTNLLASWNEGASLVPILGIHQSTSLRSATDRSASRTSKSRSVSPATSEGIHQAVASSRLSTGCISEPATISSVSPVETSISKLVSAPKQSCSPPRMSMTVGKYDLPSGVPAGSYVCWRLPDQQNISIPANRKRKRTPEEITNFKAVRTIKACLRCRRLKIKCSGMDPCSGCVDVLRRSTRANPTTDSGLKACVRTLMSSNFFLKDGNLPNVAGFPEAGKIAVENLQEAFDFSFRNLLTSDRVRVDNSAMEKLDDLYIKALVRAFPHQTCVAKVASTSTPAGLNIFIKSNTVLILEALFPEEVAEVKPYLELLRALSSIYLLEILRDATSPAKLRSANLDRVINIITVLALLTEQILDLNDLSDTVRWSKKERKLQDWVVIEMVGHLHYLILNVFSSKSRILKFVDLNKRQRLLENTFWTTFANETLKLVSKQQPREHGRSEMPLALAEENDAMLFSSGSPEPPRRPENTRSEEAIREATTEASRQRILPFPRQEILNENHAVPEPAVQELSGPSAKADKKRKFGKLSARWDGSMDAAASKVRSIKAAVKASAANEVNGIRERIQKSRMRRENQHDLGLGGRVSEFFRMNLDHSSRTRHPSSRRDSYEWDTVPLRLLNVSAQTPSYQDGDFD